MANFKNVFDMDELNTEEYLKPDGALQLFS
jgi:hypothetical protein